MRWSDMDAYGHVNHARTVTLLEGARTELLFRESRRRGTGGFDGAIVVAKLFVDYKAPILYTDSPLHVEVWVTELRTAWFVLDYSARALNDPKVLVTARTTMAPLEAGTNRPRRISPAEREFLSLWTVEEPVGAVGERGA